MLKVKPHPDYPSEEGRYIRGNDFSPVVVAIILNCDEDKIPPDIERLIRTIKSECTRRLLIPYRRDSFRRELALFETWYNGNRPSEALDGKTPDEVYHDLAPACLAPRFEPRRKWPRDSPCAAPRTGVRGRRGVRLELSVNYLAGRKHLPIVELKRAA